MWSNYYLYWSEIDRRIMILIGGTDSISGELLQAGDNISYSPLYKYKIGWF